MCDCVSLSSERAVTSPSESAAIVTSFVECLRYCVLQNAEDVDDQGKIRTMLNSQQVESLSHACFSHNGKASEVGIFLTFAFVFL